MNERRVAAADRQSGPRLQRFAFARNGANCVRSLSPNLGIAWQMAWSKEGLTQSLQIDILLSRAVQTFEHHSRELFLHTIHSVSVYGRQAAQRRAP